MKIKCDYCDSWINDFDETCPNCGATNSHYVRQSDKVPKTIDELKAWAKAMNLPLADMRTFIGEDYRGPKAFGIYKDPDDGTFVVYKNKADGSRAVRYKGSDEAYAVNELYMKMKERVADQKARQAGQPRPQGNTSGNRSSNEPTRKNKLQNIITIIILIVVVQLAMPSLFNCGGSGPRTGYYTYGNNNYYYYHGSWYEWMNDAWTATTVADWMNDDYSSYYDSNSYDSSADYDDFDDSPYYDPSYDDDDTWDSDSSWDSDSGWDSDSSWDSGSDDWGSDW